MHNKELRKEIDKLKSREEEIRMLRQNKEAELRRIIQEDSSKRYSKLFTVAHGFNNEPLTILVEAFKHTDGETAYRINTLDGEYEIQGDFLSVQDCAMLGWELGWPTLSERGEKIKVYNEIYLLMPGVIQLVEVLNEAIKTME